MARCHISCQTRNLSATTKKLQIRSDYLARASVGMKISDNGGRGIPGYRTEWHESFRPRDVLRIFMHLSQESAGPYPLRTTGQDGMDQVQRRVSAICLTKGERRKRTYPGFGLRIIGFLIGGCLYMQAGRVTPAMGNQGIWADLMIGCPCCLSLSLAHPYRAVLAGCPSSGAASKIISSQSNRITIVWGKDIFSWKFVLF